MTKVKAHPGPWPSIPVPLLLSKCSEQAASGSRKQQQQKADSSRQQQNEISKYGKEEAPIVEMDWNIESGQRAGGRRLA